MQEKKKSKKKKKERPSNCFIAVFWSIIKSSLKSSLVLGNRSMHYLTVTQTGREGGREGGQTGPISQHRRSWVGAASPSTYHHRPASPGWGCASTLPAGEKTPCDGRTPEDWDEM